MTIYLIVINYQKVLKQKQIPTYDVVMDIQKYRKFKKTTWVDKKTWDIFQKLSQKHYR